MLHRNPVIQTLKFAFYPMRYAFLSSPCALRHAPYALLLKPYTLYLIPYTLYPIPFFYSPFRLPPSPFVNAPPQFGLKFCLQGPIQVMKTSCASGAPGHDMENANPHKAGNNFVIKAIVGICCMLPTNWRNFAAAAVLQ